MIKVYDVINNLYVKLERQAVTSGFTNNEVLSIFHQNIIDHMSHIYREINWSSHEKINQKIKNV